MSIAKYLVKYEYMTWMSESDMVTECVTMQKD
jgi:hypothetical protein